MLIIFIRTILLYIMIIFVLRIMGKRQIGQLQPSELVVTILISNIASLPIEDQNIPLAAGAVPMLVMMSLEVLVAQLCTASRRARSVISGTPVPLIHEGEIDQQKLKELRLSADDLLAELRVMEIFDLEEVLYAQIETSGKISVYKRADAQNVTRKDMKLYTEEDGPQILLISNGVVIRDAFALIEQDEQWMRKKLKKKGTELKDVLLMTANKAGRYRLVKKAVKR